MKKKSQHIANRQNIADLSVEGSGFSGTLYAQLLDPEPKRARVKSEDGGGAAFTIDLPAGLLEDLEDMLPLHLFESL